MSWPPSAIDASPRRTRKHAMADQVRDLIRDLSQLDVEALDDVSLEDLEGHLASALKILAAAPDVRSPGGGTASSAPGDDGALFERSPLTGRSNPLAAPLHLDFDGHDTTGWAIYHEAYEGPPGCVHGGVVIAAFDDLLGVAQAASGSAGMTGTLTVVLRATTPLNQLIDYEAGVTSIAGRKITAWGRSFHDGKLLAECTGIFIAPRS